MNTNLHEPCNHYMCSIIVLRLAKLVAHSIIFCVYLLLKLVCFPDLESYTERGFLF